MTEAPTRDLRTVELTAPGGELVARFVVGAGMVGCSLRHRGEELLGLGGGIDAYLGEGKVFGLPLLYPWANRLGGWSYEAAGREVALDRGSPLLHGEEHCLPIHGALAAGSHWELTQCATSALRAELE
jgi:aldose 1-epimerase